MSDLAHWRRLINKLPVFFYVLAVTLTLTTGCNSKTGDEGSAEKIDDSELCYIHFYIINNQAKIYIDGELVHDTQPINGKISSERDVSLSKYLTRGNHTIKIELWNGEGLPGDEYDKYWEIYYEIFLKGVPIDYIHEQTDNGKPGLVWSGEHEITIE